MAVGVTHHKTTGEAETWAKERNQTVRDKISFGNAQRRRRGIGIFRFELRLPVYEVVGVFIHRNGAAVARAQVFQQFDSRAGGCAAR